MAKRGGVVAGGGRPDRVLLAHRIGARPHRDRPVTPRLLPLQVEDRPRCGVHLRVLRCWFPERRRATPRPLLQWSPRRPPSWFCPCRHPTRRTGTPPLPESSSPHEASSRLARGWRSTPRVGLLACGSMPNTAAFPGDMPPGGTMAADSPLTVARQRRTFTGFPSPGALFSCGVEYAPGLARIRRGAGGYT